MKEAFIERRFSPATATMIAKCNQILEQYRQQGYRLTLRQLYYQLVSRDLFPKDRLWRKVRENEWVRDPNGTPNAPANYKWLGGIITDARLAGLIDWAMIEDRNRETVTVSHWESPAEILNAAAQSFRLDKWEGQPYHIECMVEKDALSGVLEPVCRQLDIGFTANKGYSSSSTMYEIGTRLYKKYTEERKKLCVIYLGDHDPSGIDMTRDVYDRLFMFAGGYSKMLDVERVALNYGQVEVLNLPENPAKETDSRFKTYRDEFGDSSWELDAVEPTELAQLVRNAVEERRDDDLWDEAVEREEKMRAQLRAFADTFEE